MTPSHPERAFLRDDLGRHRGASQHTCDSYARSFQSLFRVCVPEAQDAAFRAGLEQVDAHWSACFWSTWKRRAGTQPKTRNVRLAAIRSFFRFLQHREPAHWTKFAVFWPCRSKRADTRLVPYLSPGRGAGFAGCT